MELDIGNIQLGNEQIETMAYNFYKDIEVYIKEHYNNYLEWLLHKVSTKLIQRLDGEKVIEYYRGNYNYKICTYEGEL